MRSLAFLVSLIGSAVCQHWGLPQQIADTPDVAAAKSAHLAALSQAQDRSWSGIEDDGSYRPEHYESWNDDGSRKADDRSWEPQAPQNWEHSGHDDGSYRPEHHNGPWADDHSHAHWVPQQQQWTHPGPQQHWGAPEKKWTGPIALPPGYDKNGAPLQVLDTPEVAAEKSKHFHLYAHGAYAAAAAHHQ